VDVRDAMEAMEAAAAIAGTARSPRPAKDEEEEIGDAKERLRGDEGGRALQAGGAKKPGAVREEGRAEEQVLQARQRARERGRASQASKRSRERDDSGHWATGNATEQNGRCSCGFAKEAAPWPTCEIGGERLVRGNMTRTGRVSGRDQLGQRWAAQPSVNPLQNPSSSSLSPGP
jgi:hypothetical protein